MRIHRKDITSKKWMDTSFFRSDGKQEFRERVNFGNRHVVFDVNSQCGEVHNDKHNVTDFPNGTLNHAALYTNEQTGIPEDVAKIGIVGLALYGIIKILKYLK